jgi:hypothetical protein
MKSGVATTWVLLALGSCCNPADRAVDEVAVPASQPTATSEHDTRLLQRLLDGVRDFDSLPPDEQAWVLAESARLGLCHPPRPLLVARYPELSGFVERVECCRAWVRITANPEGAAVEPGYRFAVYDDQKYYGELIVEREADGLAECRIEIAKAEVVAGLRASTRTGL